MQYCGESDSEVIAVVVHASPLRQARWHLCRAIHEDIRVLFLAKGSRHATVSPIAGVNAVRQEFGAIIRALTDRAL